jgi:hypothetical protein
MKPLCSFGNPGCDEKSRLCKAHSDDKRWTRQRKARSARVLAKLILLQHIEGISSEEVKLVQEMIDKRLAESKA